jgi:hypothetical protein
MPPADRDGREQHTREGTPPAPCGCRDPCEFFDGTSSRPGYPGYARHGPGYHRPLCRDGGSTASGGLCAEATPSVPDRDPVRGLPGVQSAFSGGTARSTDVSPLGCDVPRSHEIMRKRVAMGSCCATGLCTQEAQHWRGSADPYTNPRLRNSLSIRSAFFSKISDYFQACHVDLCYALSLRAARHARGAAAPRRENWGGVMHSFLSRLERV